MSSSLRKVVIPVAGLGTRFLPATKAIPKEMITLVDEPLIQYVVREAVSAGFTDIILVTHSSKGAIENHFDHNFELEKTLAFKNKTALLAKVGHILPEEANIISVRQPQALGLGHAVLCAAPIIGDEDFAVMLPDVILNNDSNDLKNMAIAFEKTKHSQIMVEPVPTSDVDKYGIADCLGVDLQPGKASKMSAIVEKPKIDEAPSNLSVTGRYILNNQILNLLKVTPKGAGNEIQLTDAIAQLMEIADVDAYCLAGKSYDCGDKLGYLKATVEFAMQHPELSNEFTTWLKEYMQ
ncbi:UTP--glucose-1-phosphate uridylyltransferase [Thiomicrorhabdus immobilis]|uniref:UTP--glucose-1-phosphate uridylyltransferase n=1 Tax=Thiomicrorhabdus immobilis TaxID=2791037 RepID=A0ABM7MBP8_9GAMM|nr:UTP--glucose-1-phosphate uridylyltransferase GalU [Thiomicrorhabdus immobilis]BCN92723.1 UTP--glucose-1-phosphate uridylyltransferase [Thiomicrorhabdus immobilis]